MSDATAGHNGVPRPAAPAFREPAFAEPAAAPPAPATPIAPAVPLAPLLVLRDGIPGVIDDVAALRDAAAALAAGQGPVSVDAERASSYRYGHRAYLVQLRRAGSGTHLIDPIACADLAPVGVALSGAEWILHAANQDLPCLREVGMAPSGLFDTELAGRLAGFPRVGLATMVEGLLGKRMEKSHSAADWSRRPLPEPWLRYAALDVEVLLELRDLLETELARQGKLEWAREEFEHVRLAPPQSPSPERWRRASGIHRIRNRRQLAVIREMWLARDRLARAADISPTRLLPDASILHVALKVPASAKTLASSAEFVGRGSRRHLDDWWQAISRAMELPDADLPVLMRPAEGPPPAHRWGERNRTAADRLATAKAVVSALAEKHNVPAENLLQPGVVRWLSWQPPDDSTPAAIGAALTEHGARRWQVELAAASLAEAFERLAAGSDVGAR